MVLLWLACVSEKSGDALFDTSQPEHSQPVEMSSETGADSADPEQDTADVTELLLEEPSRWHSSLYPRDWTAESSLIVDFSYAGYRFGEEPPTIDGPVVDVTAAPYLADSEGVTDSTQAIQAALDDVGASGGGVVYLPAGTYVLSIPEGADQALLISDNNVVLRGAGRDKSFLLGTSQSMRSKRLLYVRPSGGSSWTSTSETAGGQMTSDGMQGDSRVAVADTTVFQVGDWVIIRQDITEEWIAEYGMTGEWTTDLRALSHLRRIEAVDGNELQLDIPLRSRLRIRDGARVDHASVHLQEVGLEDFSVGMIEHPGTGWGDGDYNVMGTAAYDVHASRAITFYRVVHGWIHRVGSYRPPGNVAAHILSDGIQLYQSRNITVADCQMSYPQYGGGGGNGYGFVMRGSDNLLRNSVAVGSRHTVSFKSLYTTGNVVSGFSSANSRYPLDFHMHLSAANLVERVTLERDYIDATYRPYGTITHGFTTTDSIFWNIAGIEHHENADFLVDSRQYGWGAVVGTSGVADRIQTTPVVDVLDTSPEDHSEGAGQGGTLWPESLYLDQRSRRLEGAPIDSQVQLERQAAVADSYVRGGEYSTENYGQETHLDIKDASEEYQRTAFLRFDLPAGRPIHKAVLVLSGRVSDDNGSEARITVRSVEDDSWTEEGVHYNDQPQVGQPLSSDVATSEEGLLLLDVTAFAQQEALGDGEMSLALVQDLAGVGYFTTIDSREGVTPPVLELQLGREPLGMVSILGDEPQPDNGLANLDDGNINSYWANDAFGASLIIDLGQVQQTNGIAIAFHNGEQRMSFQEIRGSSDGTDYRPLVFARSHGMGRGLQFFGWEPAEIRYLQVVGYGNSDGDWNSYAEVSVY